MIIEGLLTTQNESGDVNLAPMGPRVHGDFRSLTFRPFKGSTTYENLRTNGVGVFHVIDEVDVIADSVTRTLRELPAMQPAEEITGQVLENCCRWFEFRVTTQDLSEERTVMEAEIVHRGDRRGFYGFNRARHAVIEAAILASRVHILPFQEIADQMERLQPAISKTGGKAEVMAFEKIRIFLEQNRKSVVHVGS